MADDAITPKYVLGDWGTSRLRLFLMENDAVAGTREGPGIGALASLSPGSRIDVLAELVAPWASGATPLHVLLCGMAGSRNGLAEVPYATLPLNRETWLRGVRILQTRCMYVAIAGGARSDGRDRGSDVMRGEEAQIFGAMELEPNLRSASQVVVLPGTHSKWVAVANGSIARFRTAMTGELYALLRDHSTLFRATAQAKDTREGPDAEQDEGFDAGVARSSSREGGLLTALFEARAAQLLDQRSESWARGFVSGLLIASEIDAMSETFRTAASVCLIGDSRLVSRYRGVFAARGLETHALDGDECAVAGLQYLRRHLTEQ
jgi:2-dehydro-3-deoxygalactonokinase